MATRGHKLFAAGSAVAVAEPAMALAHQGGLGVIVGLALGVAAYAAVDEVEKIAGKEIPALPARPKDTGKTPVVSRLLSGKSVREQSLSSSRLDFNAEDELVAPRQSRSGMFLFSEVLKDFTPTLDKIYIGTLETGERVYCKAEDLCHVALGGTTRAGKSSIMRMLMAQLCYVGASVLVLNPHHSKYILDKKEDWTPFDPYLMHDPMECKKYENIEHFLKQVATVLLPKRLDRFAHGEPVGKPYFLALDELPAIVKHIPDASTYLDDILREGAKVGIFLICASQDFLVKTLKLEGGAVRECYRSAFYVGGDSTTGNVLLDMPAKQIPEDKLGRGTIMLRNWQVVKRSVLAYVPYVDNNSLYSLLGPSTYVPSVSHAENDDSLLERRTDALDTIPETPRHHNQMSSYDQHRQRIAQRKPAAYSVVEKEQQPVAQKSEIEMALEAYDAGSTTVDALAVAMGKTQWTVRPLYAQVKALRK